jgi:hypothetical protein
MPDERDDELASVDSAIESELEHEEERDAAAKQNQIQKMTREDDLD